MTTDSWDWAVSALAEELAETPAPIRRQVLKNLVQRADDALADAKSEHDARVLSVRAELVLRLVARMQEIDGESAAGLLPIRPRAGPRRIFLQVSCNAGR